MPWLVREAPRLVLALVQQLRVDQSYKVCKSVVQSQICKSTTLLIYARCVVSAAHYASLQSLDVILICTAVVCAYKI